MKSVIVFFKYLSERCLFLTSKRFRNLFAVCLGFGALLFFFFSLTGYFYKDLNSCDLKEYMTESDFDGENQELRLRKALKKMERLPPRGVFVIIDREHNELQVRNKDEIILVARVSAGAGSRLTDPETAREWVFDTPSGKFSIVNKRSNPVWVAPDWEYIESNEPYPRSYSDRVQTGVLGEYALDLNISGYMIHGTLYSRLLGRNVTHGCIRVGRDDLREIWKKVPTGSKVFIY